MCWHFYYRGDSLKRERDGHKERDRVLTAGDFPWDWSEWFQMCLPNDEISVPLMTPQSPPDHKMFCQTSNDSSFTSFCHHTYDSHNCKRKYDSTAFRQQNKERAKAQQNQRHFLSTESLDGLSKKKNLLNMNFNIWAETYLPLLPFDR